MNGSSKQVTQPGFRPDLIDKSPSAGSIVHENEIDADHRKLARSDSDEIVRELKLGFFDKLRLKLMSPEEKEAFLIQKINEEKERRKKQESGPPPGPAACSCRKYRCTIS